MSAAFDRIAALNERLHFCEDFHASGPVDRAQQIGAGPLSGRPIGIKSNIRVQGQAWTAGIGARATDVAAQDAPLIADLRAAGATLLSRLAMDEGALGAATDNPHFERCENPAWPGHSAGGSSGGSAAAVAAGAVDAALGSDTMGSVRIPAAYCGVYGLKLGPEAVDMAGVMPLAPSLDALGIFAQTPEMLGEVLDVMARTASAREITSWCTLPEPCLSACKPQMRFAYDQMSAQMTLLLGAPEVMDPLDLPALRSDAFLLTEAEAAISLGDQPGLSRGLEKLIAYGRTLTPERMAEVRARPDAARAALRSVLGVNRVLLLPTVSEPAFAHGARPPVGQADFTVLANIAGLPALAIPMAGAAFPLSVQLVGPPGAESALLRLAAQL
ncbi:amidase family protein [Tateyamaria pelophila]|uniref:amidase family protein n=1 Tax=Tateyamaria pelophila TaxID=328415 RepID=UPI001CBF1C3B|nr:amidase [Tateyamaria pelophila]